MIGFPGLKNFKLFLENDFTFITPTKEYKASRYSAGFVSRKISKELRNDSTLSEYKLLHNDYGRFKIIADILDGELIQPDPKDFPFLIDIVSELENEELYQYLIKNTKLTPQNVTSYIQKSGTPELYQFAAKNILSISVSDLEELSYENLELIFSDDYLYHGNEAQLANTIFQLVNYDSRNTPLLSYLRVVSLSRNLMQIFMEFLKPCYMDERMIACLYSRVVDGTHTGNKSKDEQIEIDNENGPIFEKFYEKYHKNPTLAGFVDITTSELHSFHPQSCNSSFLLMPNFPSNKFFATTNTPGKKSIEIKFNNYAVVNGYSITSHNQVWVGDKNYMRSWCLSYYTNGRWIGLDTKYNSDALLGRLKEYNITFEKPVKAQQFKLEMIDLNSSGNSILAISRIELFGYTTKDPKPIS